MSAIDIELALRLENMPDKYPKILNSFLRFDVAPAIYCIGYNSHQGYVRDYNEDRISVVFSDKLQQNPRISRFYPDPPVTFGMYSIFDGHNGFECADFLKANLHNLLLEQAFSTRKDFETRIKKLYDEVEGLYKTYSIRNKKSFSGSCSITVVQFNDKLVVINVGDSRAIMSSQGGFEVMELSVDHKPECPDEFKRVIGAGGFVYRSVWSWIAKKGRDELVTRFEQIATYENATKQERLVEVGPWRANAGGLSVSRTFGDFEAKYRELGGTPGVIVCEPDIFELDIKGADFIVIGC
jgi:serine/threonine protein phosphatase PrpC